MALWLEASENCTKAIEIWDKFTLAELKKYVKFKLFKL